MKRRDGCTVIGAAISLIWWICLLIQILSIQWHCYCESMVGALWEMHYKGSFGSRLLLIKMELLTSLTAQIHHTALTLGDVVKLGEDICTALSVLGCIL